MDLYNAYIVQLSKGCQCPNCDNISCASCNRFQYASLSAEKLSELASRFSIDQKSICRNLSPLLYDNKIKEIILSFQKFANNLIHDSNISEVYDKNIFHNPNYFAFLFYNLESEMTNSDFSFQDELITDFFDSSLRRQKDLEKLFCDFKEAFDTLLKSPTYQCSLFHIRKFYVILAFGNFSSFPYLESIFIPIIRYINSMPSFLSDLFYNNLQKIPNFMKRVLSMAQTNFSLYCLQPSNPYVLKSDEKTRLFLYHISHLFAVSKTMEQPISISEFENEAFSRVLEPSEEYVNYFNKLDTFLKYPMVLTLQFKKSVREFETHFLSRRQQNQLLQILPPKPLSIKVSRKDLIRDTIRQLSSKNQDELRNPLNVTFKGEKGIDGGGLSREFFYQATNAVFSPDYGMFEFLNGRYWFSLNSAFVEMNLFKTLGILVGLAIHNSVILPIRFPIIMYKLIIGTNNFKLSDLAEIKPEVAKSLEELSKTKDDISQTYMTFSCDYKQLDQTFTEDFIEDGRNVYVTNDNIHQYIECYLQWTFSKSIEKPFHAFKEGFDLVCKSTSFGFFYPEEIDILVSGIETINWEDLKATTKYTDGYDERSPTILDFWEVISEFTEKEKLAFLIFTAGTSRSDINGLGGMGLSIQRSTDVKRLPVAHTCSTLLTLPDYKNIDTLRRKLKMAIECSEGFEIY